MTHPLEDANRAAQSVMTAKERAAYANYARYAVQPVGGPFHFLVLTAAHTIDGGFTVWPSLDQFDRASKAVMNRLEEPRNSAAEAETLRIRLRALCADAELMILADDDPAPGRPVACVAVVDVLAILEEVDR